MMKTLPFKLLAISTLLFSASTTQALTPNQIDTQLTDALSVLGTEV
ncbi:hypothetical protein [Gallibacterium genomosp. 3]|nr:hypothetical protein [Gallibacterium genomosp. 3]